MARDNKPIVSIVLPTYNGSRYLAQSIESCLGQSSTEWELIIVDDASTDSTPDIISRYVARDARVRSLRHETNRKTPVALNTGFAQARGSYLTWTSDDNCYRPRALEEMTAFLNSHPDVDIVYTDYSTMGEDNAVISYCTVRNVNELWLNSVIGPCFLYREVVQKKLGGYAEDLFLCEDYDFWLRASANFRAEALHNDLYLFRTHSKSLTAVQHERHLAVHEKTQLRNFPNIKWMNNKQRASGFLKTANRYWKNGNTKAARRNLLRALTYSPGSVFKHRSLAANILFGHTVMKLIKSIYTLF